MTPANPATPITSKISVALVEDNPDELALFRRWLESFPVIGTILAFKNSSDLLQYLQGAGTGGYGLPSLILLDLQLGTESGFDILKKLKGEGRWQKIPVVIHTASDNRNDLVKSYRDGSIFFLKKSKDKTMLFNIISELRMKGFLAAEAPAKSGGR